MLIPHQSGSTLSLRITDRFSDNKKMAGHTDHQHIRRKIKIINGASFIPDPVFQLDHTSRRPLQLKH